MKKRMHPRHLILGLLMLALLLALALPAPAQAQGEDFTWMLLTVTNESQFDYTLYLYGGTNYTLVVPPKTTTQFFVDKGWYAYSQVACNLTTNGTFDFTSTHYTINVPICGAPPSKSWNASLYYDTATDIRPIRIKIRNKTRLPIELYVRTLTEHHFMTFDPLETQELLLDNQDETYAYSYVACGELRSGYLLPRRGIPFDLECSGSNK